MLMDSFTLDVSAIGGLTDEEFFRLATSNKELKLERTASGEIITALSRFCVRNTQYFQLTQIHTSQNVRMDTKRLPPCVVARYCK